jgi:hypothetical protein
MITAREMWKRISLARKSFIVLLNTIVFNRDIINTTVLAGKLNKQPDHSGGYFF